MAHLTLVKSPEGPQPAREFPLTAERTYLGRNPDAVKDGSDLLLIPHHAVSRKHAEIVRSGAGFYVHDLKSRSGVYVNDRNHKFGEQVPLADGARIKICDFVFVFHSGAPASGAPADPP